MLTQQLVCFLWKRKNSIKGMAFGSAKKKKDLGTRGSHSPAVRRVRAHGDLVNGPLRIQGSDCALQAEPLLLQGVMVG